MITASTICTSTFPRRDAEGRAKRGRGHRRGDGVADEQAVRAFGHGDDGRNQPAWARAARRRHQGKSAGRVAVRPEAGDLAGRKQTRLAGRAGGSARETESAFCAADFRSPAPGAGGEMNKSFSSSSSSSSSKAEVCSRTRTRTRRIFFATWFESLVVAFPSPRPSLGRREREKRSQLFGESCVGTGRMIWQKRKCPTAVPSPIRRERARVRVSGCYAAVQMALVALIFFFGAGTPAETTNTLSAAKIQGHALVQKILEQQPAENFTNSGVLKIHDAKGKISEIPVEFEIVVKPMSWLNAYRATFSEEGSQDWKNWGKDLTIEHSMWLSSHYEITDWSAHGIKSNGVAVWYYDVDPKTTLIKSSSTLSSKTTALTENNLFTSFAGSDFCFADLGLEFFH